jgi:hypothetical protein
MFNGFSALAGRHVDPLVTRGVNRCPFTTRSRCSVGACFAQCSTSSTCATRFLLRLRTRQLQNHSKAGSASASPENRFARTQRLRYLQRRESLNQDNQQGLAGLPDEAAEVQPSRLFFRCGRLRYPRSTTPNGMPKRGPTGNLAARPVGGFPPCVHLELAAAARLADGSGPSTRARPPPYASHHLWVP